MINHYIDQENHILEMTISGKIEKQELKNTLEALSGPFQSWSEVRMLKRIDSFEGMGIQAWIDDLKFAYNNFSNLKKIKKVAVVTDKDWIENMAQVVGSIFPYEVKVFEGDDIEKARLWLK